jgi:hypothetical protein
MTAAVLLCCDYSHPAGSTGVIVLDTHTAGGHVQHTSPGHHSKACNPQCGEQQSMRHACEGAEAADAAVRADLCGAAVLGGAFAAHACGAVPLPQPHRTHTAVLWRWHCSHTLPCCGDGSHHPHQVLGQALSLRPLRAATARAVQCYAAQTAGSRGCACMEVAQAARRLTSRDGRRGASWRCASPAPGARGGT